MKIAKSRRYWNKEEEEEERIKEKKKQIAFCYLSKLNLMISQLNG